MRRSLAHGMYLASRALADVGAVQGDSFSWEVAFEAPVFLPARVALDISTVQADGGALAALGLRGLEPAVRAPALQRFCRGAAIAGAATAGQHGQTDRVRPGLRRRRPDGA